MDDRNAIETALRDLTADIVAGTDEEDARLAELEAELVRTGAIATPAASLRRLMSIDRAGAARADDWPSRRLERIRRLAADAAQAPRATHRAFRREVPERIASVDRAVPAWARGARVDRTLGPFETADGRRYWFDLYARARLEELYFAGQSQPVLLFERVQSRGRDLRLGEGSLWVRADALGDGAPTGAYVGLRIQQGRLRLDADASEQQGRLTLPTGAGFSAALRLDYEKAATRAGKVGRDAAEATLSLPETLELKAQPGAAGETRPGAAEWRLFGQRMEFAPREGATAFYRADLATVVLPMAASEEAFKVGQSRSPATSLSGSAKVVDAGWVLPVAILDLQHPPEADGAGGLTIQGNADLAIGWPGLRDGPVALTSPAIVLFPGLLIVSDAAASNRYASQRFRLWRDGAFRSELLVRYSDAFGLLFVASAAGNELVLAQVQAEGRLDRPVDVTGVPFPVRTRDSLMLLWFSDAARFAFVYDDDILVDALDPAATWPVAPGEAISLAIRNALFTITPVNGLFLFARLADDAETVESGALMLSFGLYGVLPTLPDPYAANTRWLRNQTRGDQARRRPGVLLVATVGWTAAADPADPDAVAIAFTFAPLGDQADAFDLWAEAGRDLAARAPLSDDVGRTRVARSPTSTSAAAARRGSRQDDWDRSFERFYEEQFALVDVSSNADQMGVSFAWFSPSSLEDEDVVFFRVYQPSSQESPDPGAFPFQVRDLDLSAQGRFVRGFALPQVSWEPLVNLTPPAPGIADPPLLFNFYPDDGGATRLLTDSVALVPIAPIPVTEFLVADFEAREQGFTGALFTLPFGLRAFAEFSRSNQFQPALLPGARLSLDAPAYPLSEVEGGMQLRADAPEHPAESPIFRGSTLQLDNIVAPGGAPTFTGTLGESVGVIFNNEFFFDGPTPGYKDRGVPLTRIDFSGYGASTFSHWLNPNAAIAATSQTRFDIVVGRTAHEVVQVRSLLYPWGVKVVRTITIFRVSSAHVFRFDTGWQAESDGLYDFRYNVYDPAFNVVPVASPYEFHPGLVRGIFAVRNIVETVDVPPFQTVWNKAIGDPYVDDNGIQRTVDAATDPSERNPAVDMQPVWFDADVEVAGLVSGGQGGRVASRRMLGYVQRAPRGEPLPPAILAQLLGAQFRSLGGPVDCVVDLAESGQQMRITRVDVGASSSVGGDPIFVSAARGSVILPKDGSWSVVEHLQGSGEVAPLPQADSVPAIRRGRLTNPAQQTTDAGPGDLVRLANPREVVRPPDAQTRNFGLLQSTGTQKALFRQPSFQQGVDRLLGAAPDFADAYRLLNSGIFPNVADALPLNLGSFETRIVEQGYRLLDQADPDAVLEQVLPDGPLFLVNEEFLKIYVEYAKKDKDGVKTQDGTLRYGFDAEAADLGRKWLSKVNDIGMVVDLGPLKRLMIVKGKFDTEKGALPAFIEPELEFSDHLQPVIDILQILLQLQGGDYKAAFAKGLEIAMSNSADSWSYALTAKKEIPVVRFPPGPAYDAPTNPLKLECRLALGVYFNEVLAITDDPKELIPSAGAFIEFQGRLSVMCVSVAAATVYATGSVDLRTAADIKTGPSLRMKFGFGAEIAVGLPVIGTVTVLYMVSVEITLETDRLVVAGVLLFRGRAEILGGIVTVTVTIEAAGMIERLPPPQDRTNMIAQVTFGLDISIFLIINLSFSKTFTEARQIA